MKKAPFKSPKNFSATGAGMSGVYTQSNVSAYPPHRNRFAAAEQNLRRIAEIAPQGVFHTLRGDFGDKSQGAPG